MCVCVQSQSEEDMAAEVEQESTKGQGDTDTEKHQGEEGVDLPLEEREASELKGREGEMEEQASGKKVEVCQLAALQAEEGMECSFGDNPTECSSTEYPMSDAKMADTSEENTDVDTIPVLIEEEEESEKARKELLEEIVSLLEEKKKLETLNDQVQHRVAKHLARRKVCPG